jgi:carbamate kinase
LALELKADLLVILTTVDKVSINYRQPDQKDLDEMSVNEAEEYIDEGHFAKGSMLPKVESCLEFVKNSDGRALITSLQKAKKALQGKTGTVIHK